MTRHTNRVDSEEIERERERQEQMRGLTLRFCLRPRRHSSKDFDLSGGPSFRLQVQCPYNRLPSGQLPKPTVGINFTSGRGNRRVTSVGANSFDVRTKVPISRMLRAEVCGNVKLPMLRPQYTVGSSSIESVFDVEGRFEIHVAEVNALLYV